MASPGISSTAVRSAGPTMTVVCDAVYCIAEPVSDEVIETRYALLLILRFQQFGKQ